MLLLRELCCLCLLLVCFLGHPQPSLATDEVDYYELLQVGRDATASELKKQFRRRSVHLHPDKNRNDPNAASKFNQLHTAYEALSDPDSREFYNTYGNSWKDMKDYKEKHLVENRQEMRVVNGRMNIVQSKSSIEEMFWLDPHVSILHPSFAQQRIASHDGVWVLFFGNPKCGPCKSLAPQIKTFAANNKAESDWLRVGSVNLAVDASKNLQRHFLGKANQRSIPFVVLVAPRGVGTHSSLAARFSDFEIFDHSAANTVELNLKLLQAVKDIRDIRVPELTPLDNDEKIQDVLAREIKETAAWEKKTATWAVSPSKWAILFVDMETESSSIRPVFRRMLTKFDNLGFGFRTVHACSTHSHTDTAAICQGINTFPSIQIYDQGSGSLKLVLQMNKRQLLGTDSQKYGYSSEQLSFSTFVETLVKVSAPNAGHPYKLQFSGVPDPDSNNLNGVYTYREIVNGRPCYERDPGGNHAMRYLRWWQPEDAKSPKWLITDELENKNSGFAYCEKDMMVPISKQWMVLVRPNFVPLETVSLTVAQSTADDISGSQAHDEL